LHDRKFSQRLSGGDRCGPRKARRRARASAPKQLEVAARSELISSPSRRTALPAQFPGRDLITLCPFCVVLGTLRSTFDLQVVLSRL
jgi:hypothetical protein